MWSRNCTFFCPNSQRTHLTTFFCPNTAMYRNRLIAWPGLHSPRAALASHSQSIPHWQRQTERGKVKNGPWKSEILTLPLLVTRLQGHLFAFHCQKTARRQWQLKLKRFLSSHKWNQGSLCCMTSLVGTEKKQTRRGYLLPEQKRVLPWFMCLWMQTNMYDTVSACLCDRAARVRVFGCFMRLVALVLKDTAINRSNQCGTEDG